MTSYTTLKLTDDQVRALYRAIYIHNESYAGCEEGELEGTIVPEVMARLEEIKPKLARAGWSN